MKLAVIFTGGTISSCPSGGFLSPSEKTKTTLLEALDQDIRVEGFQPFYILSEHLNGIYLTELIKCAGERLSENYDGIIITHGTDTLQYSAAALSIAFSDSKIPIVLVSSNYILSDKRSNRMSNFKYAAEFIKQKIGGVFVSYKNDSIPEIYTAESLLPHNAYSDRLSAIDGAFGYFNSDGSFVKLKNQIKHKGAGTFTLSKTSPVLWLKAYAGMNYPKTDGYKAVLFESYHSGTLPTDDRDFIDFCKNCAVPIYLSGLDDEIRYESTKIYQQLNIVVLKKQSPIYSYISLWKSL